MTAANWNTHDDTNDDPITSHDNAGEPACPDPLLPPHPQGCYHPSMARGHTKGHTKSG